MVYFVWIQLMFNEQQFYCLVISKPVKQEDIRTVILSLMVSVLWSSSVPNTNLPILWPREGSKCIIICPPLHFFISEKLNIIIGESLKIELSRIIVLDLVTLFSQPVNRNTVERSWWSVIISGGDLKTETSDPTGLPI